MDFFFFERINIDEMDVQIRVVWAQIDPQPKNFGQWPNKPTVGVIDLVIYICTYVESGAQSEDSQ